VPDTEFKLTQAGDVALRRRLGFTRRLQQVDGAVDLFFEGMKIIGRNVRGKFAHSLD
jgi:hypothetical protein